MVFTNCFKFIFFALPKLHPQSFWAAESSIVVGKFFIIRFKDSSIMYSCSNFGNTLVIIYSYLPALVRNSSVVNFNPPMLYTLRFKLLSLHSINSILCKDLPYNCFNDIIIIDISHCEFGVYVYSTQLSFKSGYKYIYINNNLLLIYEDSSSILIWKLGYITFGILKLRKSVPYLRE
jgi:hypothetical protein